ncbi:MAG: rod-binding protein [Treponema sp.]|nr:rod-binding protein [Treponema sp.]MCL2237380.1 rod-binding protein [Treponema sp.]
MEINNQFNNLGLMNMENYRPSSYSAAAKDPQKFEDMLRRHYSPQSDAQEPIDKNDKLFQLCLELETFLVKNLLTSMRNTVQKSGLVEEGFAGKMYEDMLYDEYAKDLTKNAGFGLAEQAYNQLRRLQ